MRKVGLVGLGVIGRAICRAADGGKLPLELVAVHTRTEATARAFLATLERPPLLTDLAGVVGRSELVVEAAGGPAVDAVARAALGAGKDLMVLSVGALLEREDLVALARERGCRIFAPSGAMVGLDGVKSASAGRIDSVTMTTRKPPGSLKDAPLVRQKGLRLEELREPAVIFEGNALEACKAFPANVNVSAAVSLAGVGPRRTLIRIVCDPTIERNTHDVEVTGEFGKFSMHIEGVPSENMRTGVLSYLSAVATLRDLSATLVVGT
ncbi:MAG: aspartate dehydrogenase [Nitrospinota bacterium]